MIQQPIKWQQHHAQHALLGTLSSCAVLNALTIRQRSMAITSAATLAVGCLQCAGAGRRLTTTAAATTHKQQYGSDEQRTGRCLLQCLYGGAVPQSGIAFRRCHSMASAVCTAAICGKLLCW
jgi:hypothetical protein